MAMNPVSSSSLSRWSRALACALALVGFASPALSQDSPARTPEQKSADNYAGKLMARAHAALAAHNPRLARDSYEEAVKALERAYGPHHVTLVKPLRGLAETRRREDSRLGAAVEALARVSDIYDRHPEVPFEERLQARVELGDYRVLAGDYQDAVATYQHAWNMLVERESADSAARAFNTPETLKFSVPRGERDTHDRTVTVRYTITAQGLPASIEVVEIDAPRNLVRNVRSAFGESRYRPRMVDGETVDVEGVAVTLRFPGDGSPAEQVFDSE